MVALAAGDGVHHRAAHALVEALLEARVAAPAAGRSRARRGARRRRRDVRSVGWALVGSCAFLCLDMSI
jgi:hypothetical protein